MKIIDNKGRIFGLVNYLDLIVLLVVVLLAGKFFVLDNEESAKELLQSQSSKEVLITYYINGVKDISINSVKEGDIFRDVDTKSALGEVVKKEVSNSQVQTTDEQGNVVYSPIPDRYDLVLTLKSKGNVTETNEAIKVSNVDVQIGRSMFIESKMIRFMGVIYGIQ